jgi:hypothetical protein
MSMFKKNYLAGSLAIMLILTILYSSVSVSCGNTALDSPNSAPVINSVSPIIASRLQTIIISGSGFGDTPPKQKTLPDGSAVTLVGGAAPIIRIYDVDGLDSWEAGCEDSQWVPGGLIGVHFVSWSDNEIVLSGFGESLSINASGQWNMKVGDPLIVNVQTPYGMTAYATSVAPDQPDQNPAQNPEEPPAIFSVSPVSANRTQIIVISGSGFGNIQPQLMNLYDGSVNTVGGGSTPVIRIYDQNGLASWQAGVQDNPNSGADAIGIKLTSWNDTEIVLGGFGAAVETDSQGQWSLLEGDPLLISVLTSNGQAVYTTTVVSNQSSPNPAPTPTPTPTTTSPTPTLKLSSRSSGSFASFRVEISGNLAYNGTALIGYLILLSDSVDGGRSWDKLTMVNTDADGNFLAVWLPSVTGNYLLKAVWTGDSNYSETSTIVSFVLSPFGEQNVFSVESNSTVTTLYFNSTSRELSFGVSGDSGTTGYVSALIPKSLLSDISGLNVYLDGSQINCTSESLEDRWLIFLTYHHSAHVIVISLGSFPNLHEEVNNSQNWIPLAMVVIFVVTVANVIVYMQSRRRLKG